MVHLQCLLPVYGSGVTTRVFENAAQTVILTEDGLVPIIGSDNHTGLTTGPVLPLYKAKSGKGARQPFEPYAAFDRPIWDHWSDSIFARHGDSIVRIKGDQVSLVAGVVQDDGEDSGDEDGPGTGARFGNLCWLTSDGSGSLYCADAARLRKVQLPAAWQAGKAAAGPADNEPVVSTLPFRGKNEMWGLGHMPDPVGGPGSLVYATDTAVYRLKLGGKKDGAMTPVLLAGAEGQEDIVDGTGPEARFQCIYGLTLDGDGNIICADWSGKKNATVLRCVNQDGTVSTLVDEVQGRVDNPVILPNGYLSLNVDNQLMFFDLGLKMPVLKLPQPCPEDAAGPPPRTLAADLGSLLQKPDGSADLTLQLGERTFKVHRLILSTRCDYFKQRLTEESGFADGAAVQLTLPDADPDAFELVLRFIYTSTVDISAVLACPVAELADRLLLPELCAAACTQVLAGVAPEKVVDLLLWAERCVVRGGVFLQLLGDLEAWFVKNYDAVKSEAPDSLEQMEGMSSDLRSKLYDQLHLTDARPAKRPRKQ